MKYFLIAGEASGDLHGANLIAELKRHDGAAVFRFLGGDLMMHQSDAQPAVHYSRMAFMGVVNVLKNAGKVLKTFKTCKQQILDFQPDIVILIDYPSFNLRIAKFVKNTSPHIPVIYYILPKIWAWKTFRIRQMKRYIDRMYSILPFETDFYKKYDCEIEYVGNPSVDSVAAFTQQYTENEFITRYNLENKPVIALLAGSRRQEIAKCLPTMFEAAIYFSDFQVVVAGAPSIGKEFYDKILPDKRFALILNDTYEVLSHARAAIVNSGTATLETALLNIPQVVVYYVPAGKFAVFVKNIFIKVKYISLVNLILGRKIVTELIAHLFTPSNIRAQMPNLLFDTKERREMLACYAEIRRKLGPKGAAKRAAQKILEFAGNKNP
ncbi:MAG: lipid-A-disaccharide synthase [Prevotellaceae bacterium]|jgi:lipid-A-disaccharide synthase|nr:lipid-A-disaccharide synthase [Prevotellaceae bacterium]